MSDLSYVEDYLNALRDCAALNPASGGVDFTLKRGKRYLKVVKTRNGSSESVHAFIEVSSGDLIKAAGWSAPQRNADGTLAVRYRLADPDELNKLVTMLRTTPSALHGGYLYQK